MEVCEYIVYMNERGPKPNIRHVTDSTNRTVWNGLYTYYPGTDAGSNYENIHVPVSK